MANPFKLHVNVRAIPDLQHESSKESKGSCARRVYPWLHSEDQHRSNHRMTGTLVVHPLPKLSARPRTAPNTSFCDVQVRGHEHLDPPTNSHQTTLPELTSEHRSFQRHGHRSHNISNKEGRRRNMGVHFTKDGNYPVTPVSSWCQHCTLPSIYKGGHHTAKPLCTYHPRYRPSGSEIRDYCLRWATSSPVAEVCETKHSRSPCRLIISPTVRCVSFALLDDDDDDKQ
ncbi:hypothetical protein NDU88_002063 [Pleurodeles waltl]|uniref:Uncharacterized protein n=1 Tax=Pleurodeles waltl TaxID=8319 RepID=A0AAV7VDP4_PLEWA|nr:hypothetical protein NDU88_002063 [Pleurodeles waltl]